MREVRGLAKNCLNERDECWDLFIIEDMLEEIIQNANRNIKKLERDISK